MIGLLLFLLVIALIFPRIFGALLRVGLLLCVAFAAWWFFNPDCESDACRQALFNYQHDVR